LQYINLTLLMHLYANIVAKCSYPCAAEPLQVVTNVSSFQPSLLSNTNVASPATIDSAEHKMWWQLEEVTGAVIITHVLLCMYTTLLVEFK
jgi:hypothetical protein